MPNYLIICTDNGDDMDGNNHAYITHLANDEDAKGYIERQAKNDTSFISHYRDCVELKFTGDYRLLCNYNDPQDHMADRDFGEWDNTAIYNWSKLTEDKEPYAVAITCNINEFDILWDEEDYYSLISYHYGEESDFICSFQYYGYDFIDDGENYIKIIKL